MSYPKSYANVARNNFITVKTEGGILPADLLQRVVDGTGVKKRVVE